MGLKTTGIKFDNVTYDVDTWYEVAENNNTKYNTFLTNQGVNNNLTTGNIYLSIRTDNETETALKTDPDIFALMPGDNHQVDYDAKIWALADTENSCLAIQYFDTEIS